MTRNDFMLIADALKGARPWPAPDPESTDTQRARWEQWVRTVGRFTNDLHERYPDTFPVVEFHDRTRAP